jgi:glycosyltransferase involved in cell wall biosynthesis
LGEDEYLDIFEGNRKKYEAKWGTWSPHIAEWSEASPDPYGDQLSTVVERVSSSRGAVIFLPSIGWSISLLQRPHHLAREFARQGFVSIFDCSNAADDVKGFSEIEPNLLLYSGPQEVLHRLTDAVVWAFPYNFNLAEAYPESTRVVYDWIDDLEVFPYDKRFLKKNHARALGKATLVASVARRLHERARAARPDAIYLPNGVEYTRFANGARALPEDPDIVRVLREQKPVAGYYGALAEWFDYEMVERVAALRPDWNFLLIGPALDESLKKKGIWLRARPNVFLVGPRDYHLLPAYVRLFDVAMIPFRINDITLATSPLKLYEYFAAGKPVVTTRMPECMAYEEVRSVASEEEFLKSLDVARAEGKDEQFRKRLRDIARENSWAARVEAVIERLGL